MHVPAAFFVVLGAAHPGRAWRHLGVCALLAICARAAAPFPSPRAGARGRSQPTAAPCTCRPLRQADAPTRGVQAEFVAWLNSLNWHRDLPTEQARLEAMERYFRLVDVNVTNRLDHYDFCRLFGLLDDHHKAQTAYTSRAETAFRRFDTNCSGTIDRVSDARRAACVLLAAR